MTKDGIGVISIITLFSIILTIGAWYNRITLLEISAVILWILVAFSLYFFRDPERTIPEGENLVLSPADGKIIFIGEEFEPYIFNEEVTKISIFLSAFDVHINRIPINGKVTYFNYLKGKFLSDMSL